MDSNALSQEMQSLLSHQPWVRDLARRLVQDPNLADDLTQETFLAALKSKATPPGSRRAWLARVLRNQLFERMRTEDRRRTRELARPREEESPSTLDLVERMSMHRQVVEIVMELPEHYREVLLRRYFEGETPTVIAERLDLPISTVKTRLQRGLAQMRERLDERHGGDGVTWSLALAPLLVPGSETATLVTTKSVGVAALLVVVGGLGWFALRPSTSAPERTTVEPPALVTPVAPEDTAAAGEASRESADPGAAPAESAPLREALASFTERRATQKGQVVDIAGRPLAGVVVRFETVKQDPTDPATGSAIAFTDGGGRFELAGVGGRGRVAALDAERLTLIHGIRAGRDTDHTTLVLAPRIEVAGRVLDEDGAALAGARLELELPVAALRRLADRLDHSTPRRFLTETDELGRFTFAPLPSVPGARLRVTRESHADGEVEAPLESRDDLVLRLAPRAVPEGATRGLVLDADGRPVPDARVSNGVEVVRTDAFGAFALDLLAADPFGSRGTYVVAYHPDLGSARRLAPAAGEGWPDELRLELAPTRTIQGRVRDARGRPLRDLAVWIGDPTVFRDAGSPAEGSVMTWRLSSKDPHPVDYAEVLESLLAGSPDPWTYVRTDGEGRFELTGLLDRDYGVVAMDRSSLLRTSLPAVAAGSRDVELTLDLGSVTPRLEGRIVSHRGEPVAGVRVSLGAHAFRARHRGRDAFSQRYEARGVVSDADGRFLLRDVPPEEAFLLLGGPRILEESRPFEAHPDGSPLVLEVHQRVTFEVVLTDSSRADAFAVVDAQGEPLPLVREGGQRRESHARARFFDGASGPFETSDASAELVLYRGDVEVQRLPFELRPGEPVRLVH